MEWGDVRTCTGCGESAAATRTPSLPHLHRLQHPVVNERKGQAK